MRLDPKQKILEFFGTENLEFLRHSRNYLSGTVARNLIVAASIPILTQLLTPAEYGILSIFTSIVSILTIIAMLNLNSGVVRYYLDKRPDFDRALGTNFLFMIGFSGLFAAMMVIFSGPLAAFCSVDREVFIFAALASCLAVFIETYLAYMNASQQSRKYAVITVLRTGLSFGGSIALILMLSDKRYMGRIYGELAVVALFSGYAFYALAKLARFKPASRYLSYTLRFSLPLIPHAIAKYVLGYFDRIIIKQLTTDTATGLYSFAYDVGSIMNLIVLATIRAWRPIFFDEYRERNYEKIERMVYEYSIYIYLAATALVLFSIDLVHLFADPRYFESIHLVPIIVIGYVFEFLYTLYFQYASYQRRTELISLSTFIAGAANIGLNYWLIPIYGYGAAAATTLASFALLFALHYVNARFVLGQRVVPLRRIGPNFFVVVAVACLSGYASTVVTSYVVYLLIRIVLMALATFHLMRCKLRARRASGMLE